MSVRYSPTILAVLCCLSLFCACTRETDPEEWKTRVAIVREFTWGEEDSVAELLVDVERLTHSVGYRTYWTFEYHAAVSYEGEQLDLRELDDIGHRYYLSGVVTQPSVEYSILIEFPNDSSTTSHFIIPPEQDVEFTEGNTVSHGDSIRVNWVDAGRVRFYADAQHSQLVDEPEMYGQSLLYWMVPEEYSNDSLYVELELRRAIQEFYLEPLVFPGVEGWQYFGGDCIDRITRVYAVQ